MIPATLVLVLALAGLADMTYGTVLHYGWLQSTSSSPSFCSPTAGSCQMVFNTPQARLFGVDLSVLGMVFYTLVSVAAVMRLKRGSWPLRPFFVAAIGGAAMFSMYLIGVLLFVIGDMCKICLFAHAVNFLMAGIVLTKVWRPQRLRHRPAVLTPG